MLVDQADVATVVAMRMVRSQVRSDHDITLAAGPDHAAAIDRLAERVGDRVGLAGVLADLNRRARPGRVPGRLSRWGWRWDRDDDRTGRWYPQGVTTSAEAGGSDGAGTVLGRELVCTSWFAPRTLEPQRGSRVTFVDVTSPDDLRYRHVLLVEAVLGAGGLELCPLLAHAGGLAWVGPYLYVAATGLGVHVCRLDDIVRLPEHHVGGRDGDVTVFGYRYLLPVRFSYEAGAGAGTEPFRFSFLSVDRGPGPTSDPRLVAGEYGRDTMSTRLASWPIDPSTSLLRTGRDGFARPELVTETGVQSMQGAVAVDGSWYVTASAGRRWPSSLYVGPPQTLARRARVLPIGIEDLSYHAGRDELWSLSEHPGRRYVFRFPRPAAG